jgi:hypothetical protein
MFITFLNWLDAYHKKIEDGNIKAREDTRYPRLRYDIKETLRETLGQFSHPAFLNGISNPHIKHFIQKETNLLFLKITTHDGPTDLINVDIALRQYEENLIAFLIDELPNTSGIPSTHIIENSSRQLLEDCRNAEVGIFGFLNRMANAHAVIQLTGGSTQNENSAFAWIDFYNYIRHADRIEDARLTLTEICIYPFIPIYFEYQKIAQNETSYILKITKVVIPLLIIAGLVVGVAALIAPLAIHEAAFIVLLVPILYLGLALASAYVMIKDSIYQAFHTACYLGKYKIPEYQVSKSMELAFGDGANTIRDYYVQELKACERIQQGYASETALSTSDQVKQLANSRRHKTLLIEWYDIHGNTKLAYDKTPAIALGRFNDDQKHRLYTEDCDFIKTTLAPTITHAIHVKIAPAIRPSGNHFVFFPKSLTQKNTIASLETNQEALQATREAQARTNTLNLVPVSALR